MTTFGVVLGLGLQAVFIALLSSFIVVTCKKKGKDNNNTTTPGRKSGTHPNKSRQCNQNSGLLNDDPDLKSNANLKPPTSPMSADQGPTAGGNTNTDHQQPRTDLNSNFTSPLVPPEGGGGGDAGQSPLPAAEGGSKHANAEGQQTPSKANQPASAPAAGPTPGAAPGKPGSNEPPTKQKTSQSVPAAPSTPPEQPAA